MVSVNTVANIFGNVLVQFWQRLTYTHTAMVFGMANNQLLAVVSSCLFIT
jgi:hypothetical protein